MSILFSRSETPKAPENQEIMDLVDLSIPPPPWFTEEDLATYGALYQNLDSKRHYKFHTGKCTSIKGVPVSAKLSELFAR